MKQGKEIDLEKRVFEGRFEAREFREPLVHRLLPLLLLPSVRVQG